jgi:hypothetical protein
MCKITLVASCRPPWGTEGVARAINLSAMRPASDRQRSLAAHASGSPDASLGPSKLPNRARSLTGLVVCCHHVTFQTCMSNTTSILSDCCVSQTHPSAVVATRCKSYWHTISFTVMRSGISYHCVTVVINQAVLCLLLRDVWPTMPYVCAAYYVHWVG